MDSSEIFIQKVHNGWIVKLPPPSKLDIAQSVMQQFPEIMKSFNIDSDDVLAKIHRDNEIEDIVVPEAKEQYIEPADNILIFMTFPEVLDFLNNNIS